MAHHCEVDRPGSGSAPSCRITPSMSTSTQLSTILPSTTSSRQILHDPYAAVVEEYVIIRAQAEDVA